MNRLESGIRWPVLAKRGWAGSTEDIVALGGPKEGDPNDSKTGPKSDESGEIRFRK